MSLLCFSGENMKTEQNTLSRDWIIRHEGRTFYVNFTESDGQTLTLFNRDNWDITEETDEEAIELNGYIFSSMTEQERLKAQDEALLIKKIISYCVENWGNEFMQQLEQDLAFHADNQK